MNPSTYVEGIKELARLVNKREVSYDNAMRSAQTIAERFGKDPSWSSVDLEDAMNGKEIQE
jgi:hypothetical protein